MTTYILLRDSKESAPLTLPDLKKTGLKPTDLVWVEGQSVCWLNPSQVMELKDLVNVTIPVEETVTPKPGVEINLIPQDEIKEIYLENLNKRNRNWYENVPPQVWKIAFYALLITTGLVAGLLISNSGSKDIPDIASQTESSASGIIPASNEEFLADTTQVPKLEEAFSTESPEISQPQNNLSQKTLQTNGGLDETTSIITRTEERLSLVTEPVQPNEEKLTEEKDERKKPSIKEIYSQVSVRSNDYTVGSFGGIKNLELTVSNHSNFALDEVEVEVQYLKPMDELLKSETISIRSIPAGRKKIIPVKKTSRGVKVKLKIVGVESKEFMTNTAGF